jgi:5-methyltetrahydrofolate--homocysteine methyltransferase
MLNRLIKGRWLTAQGVIGLYPANTVNDDDIEVYADESRREVLFTWRGLRMQSERPVVDGVARPNRCLADFIAPKDSGKADHIGLFAVTAGIGCDKKEKQFLDDHDDYSAIMLKALADRLAEAFAERMHQRVRQELWGYVADESFSNEELIAEKYRGIRPAPGYPACPDHTVKADMFRVLRCEEIGMGLTESLAMTPAASVSGFYMAHPEATYFNVGKIGEDQLKDWAARSRLDESAAKRSLAPLL